MHAEEVSIEDVVAESTLFIPSTEAHYASYLKEFATFVKVDIGDAAGLIGKEFYTDENMAKYLHMKGKKTDYKPHFLKACCASLGSAIVKHSLPAVFGFPHLYPFTTTVIKVIECF